MTASVFHFPVRVYWEDTDAGGIVFYVNYLKFFERARTEWLRARGIGQRQLKDDSGGMFVVSATEVRYLQPARLDDELLVTVRVERFGAASLLLAQQVLAGPAPTGPVLCEGSIRIGWVLADTLRPARIPPSVLNVLEQP
ncbi:MAG TPA: tol-pal system-associated acyl-CoA thioesterase [Pseudorhodoferax sp.]|nr:tol-pal system-associated acyl-CoA thioesterase [Pseudorhodoferax sp.]